MTRKTVRRIQQIGWRWVRSLTIVPLWIGAFSGFFALVVLLGPELIRHGGKAGALESFLTSLMGRVSFGIAGWILAPSLLVAALESGAEWKWARQIFREKALRIAVRIPAIVLYSCLTIAMYISTWKTGHSALLVVWMLISLPFWATVAAVHALLTAMNERIDPIIRRS